MTKRWPVAVFIRVTRSPSLSSTALPPTNLPPATPTLTEPLRTASSKKVGWCIGNSAFAFTWSCCGCPLTMIVAYVRMTGGVEVVGVTTPPPAPVAGVAGVVAPPLAPVPAPPALGWAPVDSVGFTCWTNGSLTVKRDRDQSCPVAAVGTPAERMTTPATVADGPVAVATAGTAVPVDEGAADVTGDAEVAGLVAAVASDVVIVPWLDVPAAAALDVALEDEPPFFSIFGPSKARTASKTT